MAQWTACTGLQLSTVPSPLWHGNFWQGKPRIEDSPIRLCPGASRGRRPGSAGQPVSLLPPRRCRRSKSLSGQAALDQILQRGPGNEDVNPQANGKHLPFTHPAVKGSARNVSSRAAAEDPPSGLWGEHGRSHGGVRVCSRRRRRGAGCPLLQDVHRDYLRPGVRINAPCHPCRLPLKVCEPCLPQARRWPMVRRSRGRQRRARTELRRSSNPSCKRRVTALGYLLQKLLAERCQLAAVTRTPVVAFDVGEIELRPVQQKHCRLTGEEQCRFAFLEVVQQALSRA